MIWRILKNMTVMTLMSFYFSCGQSEMPRERDDAPSRDHSCIDTLQDGCRQPGQSS